MTRFQVFVDQVHKMAEEGDMDAVRFVAERTEGKVKDTLALEGGGKMTIVEEIVDAVAHPPSPGTG